MYKIGRFSFHSIFLVLFEFLCTFFLHKFFKEVFLFIFKATAFKSVGLGLESWLCHLPTVQQFTVAMVVF